MTVFRGFHYDIARGAYLRPEWFHEAIRHAVRCGYTHFLPYLENMIRLPSMEKACPDVAYRPEDWRAFEKTAFENNIELVPHFNVIGHTEHICAKYPELAGAHGGAELDVEREETREWVLSCLAEFCEVSQARYFLIGGDEWQTPNHLLERHAGHIGRLWAEHLNAAIHFLSKQNRIPIVWHDMLTHYPEALEHLSRDAVIAFWFYDETQGYPFLETLKKYGFQTLMASGCLGLLDRRHVNAVRCAMASVERYQADGFLMTSWEEIRWEYQSPLMEMTAEVLKNGNRPSESDALSAYAFWKREAGSPDEALERLKAWRRYPVLRACLEAQLTGDAETERALYEKYQHPTGRIHASIGHPPRMASAASFGIEIAEEADAGTALRFVNGAETFVIYPRYGATLQDWRYQEHSVIAHTLPEFLRSNKFASGGYRSHTRAGGFRPIWALGTHSNPCILWQHPFEWRIPETAPSRRAVEFSLSLPHVDVRYRVSIERGTSGFLFEAEAVNRLENIHAGWNFNLPLVWDAASHSVLSWGNGEVAGNEPQWYPDVKTVHLATPHWNLDIVPKPGETAGCFVDRGRDWITPDLHGLYRPRKIGETIRTQWRFSVGKSK